MRTEESIVARIKESLDERGIRPSRNADVSNAEVWWLVDAFESAQRDLGVYRKLSGERGDEIVRQRAVVDALKRQYPDYRLRCSPEVVGAVNALAPTGKPLDCGGKGHAVVGEKEDCVSCTTSGEKAQVAYNLMLQASWAAERCGASVDLTDCVLYLGRARDALCRHAGVPRMDYTGKSFGELFPAASPRGADPMSAADCPFCTHSLHDGDGASEPYSCCEDDCACRWEWVDLNDDGTYTAVYVGSEWPKERRYNDSPVVRTPITHRGSV